MKTKIFSLLIGLTFIFTACNDDVLDRPQKDNPADDTYWIDEDKVRLFANPFYPAFFTGYNRSWTTDYMPVRGYYFSDNSTSINEQPRFENTVPSSLGSAAEEDKAPEWRASYNGPTWYFGWIRKSNFMLNRLETRMKPILSTEAYNHWIGVGRFFRGLEYSRLVGTFGDMPYFDKLLETNDVEEMYKDRQPRGEVMDKVYDDFQYALQNVRTDDGELYVNRYIVASFVARWMLFEGTWQKYHLGDNERAKKYLQLAVDASEIIMNSGKYAITGDFKSLFASDDLKGHKGVILYRRYDRTYNITHIAGTACNLIENQGYGINLNAIKSFICNDGNVWENTTVKDADKFDIANLIKTRDPRFEATFLDRPLIKSSTLLYSTKFISREGIKHTGTPADKWNSTNNENDAPVMRYAEVLLNWIEAKAELETLGGTAVIQSDINLSINAIRNRDLDAEAIAKGVKKTSPLMLNNMPNDPTRDADVSPLIWEIRRERRMEFIYEHSRLLDIKRWKKIEYMDCDKYPDYAFGLWVTDAQKEIPDFVKPAYVGKLRVRKANGNIVTYNGNNAADLVGFYMVENAMKRPLFTDRVYLSPIGQNEINHYANKGYRLSQTKLW